MSEPTNLPGWRVLAVPSDWNPDELSVDIRPQTVDYVTLPDSFLLFIQTAEMVAQDQHTAVIVSFVASQKDNEVRLTSVYGMGSWVDHFADVVNGLPPTTWRKLAIDLMAAFIRNSETRELTSEEIGDLPLQTETPASERPNTSGMQRRRKITPEHLAEVARVYKYAQADAAPPTRAVQNHFNVSHSTAAKWVGAARRSGYLPAVESILQ